MPSGCFRFRFLAKQKKRRGLVRRHGVKRSKAKKIYKAVGSLGGGGAGGGGVEGLT